MDTIWEEIGIHPQHVCETTVPGRFHMICDKRWLQSLEQHRKIIDKFPTYPQLDRRAHPTGVLDHPWTRILVQTYKKQAQRKVFPLPPSHTDGGGIATPVLGAEDSPKTTLTDFTASPLSYSQGVAYVTATNFKNLWEAAYKRYDAAHNKFPHSSSTTTTTTNNNSTLQPDCSLMPYDDVLRELIQRIFNCPVIHCKADRLKENSPVGGGEGDGQEEDEVAIQDPFKANDCHANVMPAIVAIESSTHISVFFYPPAVVTSLYDCITYSPAVLSKSYIKPLFLIYQLLQLSRAMQSQGLFMGDVRLHDIYMRDNLWIQVVPHLETNILQARQPHVEPLARHPTTPSELAPIDSPDDEYAIGATDIEYVDDEDDEEGAGTKAKFDLKFAYDLQQFTLREYCEMWCNGQMSNFDYLTILNNATERTTTDPAYHHIMPWVTDFSARNGANWRDLTKSKYRLNKGDIHLDLMFSQASQPGGSLMGGASSSSAAMHLGSLGGPTSGLRSGLSSHLPLQNVPHHVSDSLSEITYFVYTARRTPQHILCEHVRKVWVPAEYPVSIQRLQQWTPDECIPEFYTDPMIFKSIHEDLPDLELPAWASCPEDFICKHREALESQYVSERLHHWIDLNFGYKLSGKAAVKSKNVCLSVVDQHKNLCQRGVVQLFSQPHPPKRFPSPWFNKQAPRLSHLYNSSRDMAISPSQRTPNDSKRFARSSENLSQTAESTSAVTQAETLTTPTHSQVMRSSPRLSSAKARPQNETTNSASNSPSTAFYPLINACIELPRDYNPCLLLQSLETMQQFCSKTFPKQAPNGNAQEKIHSGDLLFDGDSEDHSFTNQLFGLDAMATPTATTPSTSSSSHKASGKSKNLLAPNVNVIKRRSLKLLLKDLRQRELYTLGCFIVELFSLHRLRPLLMTGVTAKFSERLDACRTVTEVYRQDLPKCVRSVVADMLVAPEGQKTTTDRGLPPPTAAQLLEPIFYNLLIPFPNNFYPVYALIRSLHSFDFASTLLELNTHFNCNGQECGRYTEIDGQRVLFERKIAECKVMSCCAHMGHLLEPIGYEQFSPVELLLPHIIDLLSNEQTSILTAWNLFDPVAQALGVVRTQKYLLAPIMKLYDVESFERGMISVRSRSSEANGNGSNGGGGQVRFSTSSSFKSRKSVKLYHHSFLLRLIVRFGLRCFLHNFIAPLIEAVGGYKEPEDCNGLHYHSVAHESARRVSKQAVYDAGDDPSSSITLVESPKENKDEEEGSSLPKQDVEEVFSFDDDANSDHVSNAGTFENKSIDSFDMRAASAEEAQEDFNQAQTTPEKLAISELIYGSNMSFEEADKISAGSNESPTVASNAETPTQLGPKSPTIDIPSVAFRRSYQLNAIDCEIGSRKSVDSFDIITQAVAEEVQLKAKDPTTPNDEEASRDSLQASVISKMSEAKAMQNNRISEMSADSLVWLSHRLGPVLTSRFITRNLLKMLTLCYVGQENLLPEPAGNTADEERNLTYFSIADGRVVGDRSAARVLECLISIAGLFGEEVILLQYFPHISELIALSNKRVTGSLEGAIISSLQLLKFLVPCLKDVTIMDNLKDTFLNRIILPILELLGSTSQLMPSGYLGRSVLARKLLDALYVLCVRIGPDMTKEHLSVTALRPFFLIFDKAFGIANNFVDDSAHPISPPNKCSITPQQERVLAEIRDVFDPALAHIAYLAFLRFLGEAIMQRTLINLEFILTLCHEFEQPAYKAPNIGDQDQARGSDAVDCPTTKDSLTPDQEQVAAANSFGTHVIGNRLEVASASTPPTASRTSSASSSLHQAPSNKEDISPMEVLDMVAYQFDQIPASRHLKGHWLAYWSHEILRSDKDTNLNFKQIKLQSFVGHTNSIRALVALDNENSFISASKDKTVKLWSLRSEGDGRKSTPCQFTYTAHKKSIHSLAFLEAMRLVVSCDSGVHFWDPFIGRTRGILDAPRHNHVTVVKSLPSPSPLIVAGTSEATVKIIDSRCMQYVCEWRVNAPHQSAATVRCMTVAPSGNWLAVGLSSGSIVMLDTRCGVLLNSWRPMECDLLQLAAPNDHVLVSSALDHSLAVWHANDGILHYQMRPPPEPAHFLQTLDSELVYATSGNRIGVYSDLGSSHAAHSITKLRSENFRGVLTSLAVLPLNRAFLAGNESGNIVMLC